MSLVPHVEDLSKTPSISGKHAGALAQNIDKLQSHLSEHDVAIDGLTNKLKGLEDRSAARKLAAVDERLQKLEAHVRNELRTAERLARAEKRIDLAEKSIMEILATVTAS
jgi:hypothetical protein